MADEKKKPDLKARLNRTVVGQPAPSGPPASGGEGSSPVVPPPGVVGPPVGVAGVSGAPVVPPPAVLGDPAGIMPPPVSAPLPSLGGDVAPPPFVAQQMAERAAAEARAAADRAAAERVAAAAADPFAASAHGAPQGGGEIRLVIDDKAVSDAEVGRGRSGMVIGIVSAALVSLVAGYLVGGEVANRADKAKTSGALGEIRRSVDAAGSSITLLKAKIDHAVAAAGLEAGEGQQPTTNVSVDMELVTWFAQQPQDPPLSPDVYAGRVGRLTRDRVTNLMTVQLKLAEVWRQLREHQALTQPNEAIINASARDAQRTEADLARMVVVMERGRNDREPPVIGSLLVAQPAENGSYTLAQPPPGVAPARTLYSAGDLTTQLATTAIPISPRVGVAAQTIRGVRQPWADYVRRLQRLQLLVTELQNDQNTLARSINQTGGS